MTKKSYMESVPFSALTLGRQARLTKVLTKEDIALFAAVTGNINPAHTNADYAQSTIFHGMVGHAVWTGSLISNLLGTVLPGPGTIYLSQTFNFKISVHLGDTVTVIVTVKEKDPDHPIATFGCTVYNQHHETVLEGSARVIVPTTKIRLERQTPPDINLQTHDHYQEFMISCRKFLPLRTAVIHPVQAHFIENIFAAHQENLLDPILVGPRARIEAAAQEAGIDITQWELIDTPHSHASAQTGVEMAARGDVAALMKGAIQTHELLEAVVSPTSGLRTQRRMSHAYLMDVTTYPKPFILTDAAINIAPSLETKVDICQNAIDLWHVLFGQEKLPKVALLAAVETVNPKMSATLDGAALCKMAQRGQIQGALLDGPLAFDNAVSREAALEKGIDSVVAGDTDIFVTPNLEAGNMLAKQLTFLAHADAAGIVLGARVPIILTSRSDSLRTRLMSCALAIHMANGARA